MAYIKLANDQTLPAMVIQPDFGYVTTAPLYPDGTMTFTQSHILDIVPFTSGNIYVDLMGGSPGVIMTLKGGITVELECDEPITHIPSEPGDNHYGDPCHGKVYFNDTNNNRRVLVDNIPYYGILYFFGVVYDPKMDDKCIAGLAYAYDYTWNEDPEILPDIYETNKLINSMLGDMITAYPTIAANDIGINRRYVYLLPYQFADTYYTASDVDSTISNTDPFRPGGTSDTGGGGGTFDDSSDVIPIPDLPTLTAAQSGFIRLYNPTISQLQALSQYMWSTFDMNAWKKLFADPMDVFLGLSIIPCPVTTGVSSHIFVGNVDTGISVSTAASQWAKVDCGYLTIPSFSGSYLDYAPFTRVSIYLPYIGDRALDVDSVVGNTLHVVYYVDIITGACNAFIEINGSVLYTFSGQCAITIPIASNDWSSAISAAVNTSIQIASAMATEGATVPNMTMSMINTAISGDLKPTVSKSGAVSGMSGFLGIQKPYLTIIRPRQALPARQNSFMGYPSFITRTLSSLSGYTEIYSIHLENVGATDVELNEIESLLKSGVIL